MRVVLKFTAIAFIFLLSFCRSPIKHKKFPARNEVLIKPFSTYENFLPIASLDLTTKGIKDKIHIMYVSFDPGTNDSVCFRKPDYKDVFTFEIVKEGKFKPTFSEKALVIGPDYKQYYNQSLIKFARSKKNSNDAYRKIHFSDIPEWWQSDQTPMNSKGEPYTFICEVDMIDFCTDDCGLFVFYDKGEQKVKYVYQRN